MLLGFVDGDVGVDIAGLQAEVAGATGVDAGGDIPLGVEVDAAEITGELEAASADDQGLGRVDGTVSRQAAGEIGRIVHLLGVANLGVAVDGELLIPSSLLGAGAKVDDGGLLKSLGALLGGDDPLLDQEVEGGIPLGGGGGECATEGGGGDEELLDAVVHEKVRMRRHPLM